MNHFEEYIFIPGDVAGETCIVDEVYHSAPDHSVSLVSQSRVQPALTETVERATAIDPYVSRIRIMTYSVLGIVTFCIFRLIDGRWQRVLPPAPLTR